MATTKPRITISLNPHVYATLKRMSELNGQPMSTIISELLDSVHEPFMRTVAFLDAAAEAPQQIKDGLRNSFEAVEREMYGAAGHTIAQMDWLTEQLTRTPAGDDSGRGASPARASPAGSIRGSSSPKTSGPSPKVNPHVVTRGSGISPPNKIKDLAKPKKGARNG